MRRTAALLGLLGSLLPAAALARPDSKGSTDMWRYGAAEVVSSFPSPGGQFRIHYTAAGVDAVPAGDADGNGTPDYVEGVAALYDQVLAFYLGLGFHGPPDDGTVPGNNGGDARFDVYLIDFGGNADGHFQREQCQGDVCEGYMLQENDFVGYPYDATSGNRILSSHEFFHAVQAGYSANQSTIVSEGTAVWATEAFDATLGDFESLITGYLDRPDRPLDKPLPGAVDPFSYGTAIYWEFLSERFDAGVIRALWEGCVDGAGGVAQPDWFAVLPQILAARGTTFAEEFGTFARWNLFTGARADAARGYHAASGYPPVKMQVAGAAPYRDATFRLFYASTQYVHIPVEGRAQMTAFVGGVTPATPVRLSLVARTGARLGPFVDVPLGAAGAPPAVDTSGADELIVLAVNTATSGDSEKGTLCAGAPDEVAPCLPMPATADMASTAPALGAVDSSGGGGCALAGRAAASGGGAAGLAGLAGLALLLLLGRRRHGLHTGTTGVR